jgi:hypothetical protein
MGEEGSKDTPASLDCLPHRSARRSPSAWREGETPHRHIFQGVAEQVWTTCGTGIETSLTMRLSEKRACQVPFSV